MIPKPVFDVKEEIDTIERIVNKVMKFFSTALVGVRANENNYQQTNVGGAR
jgi:hypothetical protein